MALDLIATDTKTSYVTPIFLQLAIYTRGQHFQDAFKVIRSNLNFDQFGNSKHRRTIGKQLVNIPSKRLGTVLIFCIIIENFMKKKILPQRNLPQKNFLYS